MLPPQPPSDPAAPGPFAFANQDRTLKIMADAGWHDVTLTRQDVPMRLAAACQIGQATEFATRVGALARMLAEETPDNQARVREVVADALRAYDTPDGIIVSGSIWLIAARP